MNLFEIAVRRKFRFESQVGQLTVEDLWDLPLTSKTKASLDAVAIGISNKLKNCQESFVVSSKTDTELEQKLAIVKHIIQVRMEENQARIDEKNKAERQEQIKELIAKKELQSLENLSIEELKALAASA